MYKKRILIILCLMTALGADQPQPSVRPEPFALFTLPKAGSHLLIKALHFMTSFSPFWHLTPPCQEELHNQNYFPYTHCSLAPDLIGYYAHSQCKQILGIRDLRDICVSSVFQIRKGIWPQFIGNEAKINAFNRLFFDEQLLFVINQECEIDDNEKVQLGLRRGAEQAAALSQDPRILICRYEDLVGFEGGGSAEAQREILQKIATRIGASITPAQIDEIASRLYGNQFDIFGQGDFKHYQSTFRDGKVGSWKMAFKPMHKEAFKKRMGQTLIALGYEKNNDW